MSVIDGTPPKRSITISEQHGLFRILNGFHVHPFSGQWWLLAIGAAFITGAVTSSAEHK